MASATACACAAAPGCGEGTTANASAGMDAAASLPSGWADNTRATPACVRVVLVLALVAAAVVAVVTVAAALAVVVVVKAAEVVVVAVAAGGPVRTSMKLLLPAVLLVAGCVEGAPPPGAGAGGCHSSSLRSVNTPSCPGGMEPSDADTPARLSCPAVTCEGEGCIITPKVNSRTHSSMPVAALGVLPELLLRVFPPTVANSPREDSSDDAIPAMPVCAACDWDCDCACACDWVRRRAFSARSRSISLLAALSSRAALSRTRRASSRAARTCPCSVFRRSTLRLRDTAADSRFLMSRRWLFSTSCSSPVRLCRDMRLRKASWSALLMARRMCAGRSTRRAATNSSTSFMSRTASLASPPRLRLVGGDKPPAPMDSSASADPGDDK
mmetsp:Transcript_22335/g.56060  ORF Transcript_22335/g.56060 Transcript_22335/m.56060 type:complete len:385 (+) Transcript_22335:104-1258(+)